MGEPRTLPEQKTTRFAPRSIGSESSFAREVAVLSMISRLNRIPCSVAFFSSSSKSSSGETHCDVKRKRQSRVSRVSDDGLVNSHHLRSEQSGQR